MTREGLVESDHTWDSTASQSSVEKALITQPRQYIRRRVAKLVMTTNAQVLAPTSFAWLCVMVAREDAAKYSTEAGCR